MLIREMKDEDYGDVAEIYKQGIDSGRATFETVCPDFERYNASHLKSDRFVAVEDGMIIGFAVFSPTSARYCYRGVVELSLYVRDGWRGKGVGSALTEKMKDAIEKQDIWLIRSCIIADNAPSIALHEKAGFRYRGRTYKAAIHPLTGKWTDVVWYEYNKMLIDEK